MGPQSYSSLTTFEKCARKFYRTRVLKDVVDTSGPEAHYGTDFHTAAEQFIRDDTPMPGRFQSMQPTVEAIKKLPGEQFVELKFALKKTPEGYAPAGFFDDDVHIRGIADVAVVNGVNGRLVDWKTGKSARYADIRQLDIMAGCMFVYFPTLETIKSALVYVVSGELIPKEHYWEKMDEYLGALDEPRAGLEAAYQNGVWNPTPSGLCNGWCPVQDCEHWKPKR
jgi:hypothetical protein